MPISERKRKAKEVPKPAPKLAQGHQLDDEKPLSFSFKKKKMGEGVQAETPASNGEVVSSVCSTCVV